MTDTVCDRKAYMRVTQSAGRMLDPNATNDMGGVNCKRKQT